MDATMTPQSTIAEQFAEQGYYIAKGVYNREEVRELEVDFDRIVQQLQSSGENINARWSGPEMERMNTAALTVIHTHNVQQYSAAWLRATMHPRFLAASQAIIGPDVVLHHSKLFQKPSEEGAPFPMHQDWTYFPTVNDTMMAGIIHVSNATDEMGCLRVYPGTHKLGRIEGTSGQHESEMLAKYPLATAKPLEAEPGDVVFFHYFLIHGSMPNRSSKVRKTVLVQMYSGQDRVVDGNTHPDEKLVLSGWNYHAKRGSVNM
jgi:phytanoyl-CoA hydroxylase